MGNIPLLKDLHFGGNPFGVPTGFAEEFVILHLNGADDDAQAWRIAQEHWEQIVEKVLDTDAVALNAQGDRAIAQAVEAAVDLLQPLVEIGGGCTLCAPVLPHRQVAEGRRRA